ncbi:MAG: hypothetical protein A2622_13755 [Bdellovibrionales bacterium RIFCSPHIGHO2_01_FULL_40_29]|nr:MAG: hypothetical protein A2622_13755 [Bdellovibrionales bacterium RIFCSPHIGHO2_01_FULL_40_29]OFZ35216.1 MAG: hypothetical protein A3D17_14405 [Bdellovibrionales bacterium RIFCSPHIGHO2_02_FULL_40_15]
MIFHIAEKEIWMKSIKEGWYQVPSLEVEGFIHCSNIDQFIRVGNFLFKGRQDLVLLEIDEGNLSAPIKYEGETEEKFPHLYGKLNISAVVRVHPFHPRPNGEFELPVELTR